MSYIPEYHENYYNVEGTAYNQGKIGIGTFKPIELLHVSGGNIRVDGTGYIDGDLNVTGNLNVYGESTIGYTETVAAEDKNIELNVKTGAIGSNSHAGALTDDVGAHEGGLTIKSTDGDHTWNWLNDNTGEIVKAWSSNENIIATGDNKIFFRDTGLFIHSPSDGLLRLHSDRDVDVIGDLRAHNNVHVGENLYVSGSGYIKDNFYVSGSGYIENNLYVSGNSYVENNLYLTGSGFIEDDLYISGSGFIEDELHVTGKGFFNNRIDISGNLNFTGELSNPNDPDYILSGLRFNGVPWRQAIWVDAPSTPSSQGTAGEIANDDDYFYVCVGENNWKRSALTTW